MELIQLTQNYELKPFDCGDADLNGFLLNDAFLFMRRMIFKCCYRKIKINILA